MGIPEGYISLFKDACAGQTCQTITLFGLCDSFSVECGLQQGAVEAPLHWKVVYDTLLYIVDNLGEGYRVQDRLDSSQNRGNNGLTSVASCAFINDTV